MRAAEREREFEAWYQGNVGASAVILSRTHMQSVRLRLILWMLVDFGVLCQLKWYLERNYLEMAI